MTEMNDEQIPQITDKGWAAMRNLLDREMPVRKKKRGLVWWWFALMLLPVAALGLWFMAGYTEKPVPVQPPQPGEHAKPQPMAADLQQQTAPVAGQILPSMKQNSGAENTGSPAGSGEGAVTSIEKKNIEIQSIVSGSRLPRTAGPSPVGPGKTAILPASNGNAGFESSGNEPFAAPNVKITWSAVELPGILPSVVSRRNVVEPAAPKPVAEWAATKPPAKPVKKAAACQLGIASAVASETFAKANAIAGGLALNLKIASKTGIRSGLQYGQYVPDGSGIIAATVQPDTYTEALQYDFTVVDNSGSVVSPVTGAPSISEPVAIALRSYRIAQLPLLAYYQPVKHLNLFGGLNIAYVTSASTKNESYSGEYRLQTNNSSAAKNLNTLAINEITRWRLEAATGIGWTFGRHLDVGVFAGFPLNNSKFSLKNNQGASLDTGESTIQETGKIKPSLTLRATWFF